MHRALPVPAIRRRSVLARAGAAITLASGPAAATLAAGAAAPPFSTAAALAGQPFTFTLQEALAKGPVVLYFYPKAFTSGCTIEAKAFADAVPRFAAAGATVVGVSADTIEVLQRFSVEACSSKFAVAADPQARVIRAYEAQLAARPDMADRVSYVIGRDGRIAYAFESPDPIAHVNSTLRAVQELAARR